ncbi:hypothetical protein FH608_027410 [Nonomuraea phyllanthi]|uniref:Uncharacterized protein n=1 Tax=Nonomuraea phyllanthi TaxID=2219224 RepID=A0A5C4W8P5_9ACTN|nr:hypothetical protein [Nonomuraea phyllanthi]KAB8192385.1 hypothetical protein FH608_027410 [Nonomuraea phyllanthi]
MTFWVSPGRPESLTIACAVKANVTVTALTTGPSNGLTSLTPNTHRRQYHIMAKEKMISHQPMIHPMTQTENTLVTLTITPIPMVTARDSAARLSAADR